MAEVKPFRGIIYNQKRVKIEDVVSPPYDIISEEERKILTQRSPYNIVHLTLGKNRNWFQKAAIYFKTWLEKGILKTDKQEAIYPYYMEYSLNGEKKLQRGFIVRTKIEPMDKGIILNHEKTFSKVVCQRLKLLRATQAHFSQVYGLYNDSEDQICPFLSSVTNATSPFIDVKIDNIRHLVWRITNKQQIKTIQELMKNKKIIIADGHHRYRTALAYKEEMKKRFDHISPDASFNYVSMYLSNLRDKSLSILPIHRVIPQKSLKSFYLESFIQALKKFFDIEVHKEEGDFWSRFNELNKTQTAIGLYCQDMLNVFYILILKNINWAKNLPLVLKKMDVMVLNRLIFKKILCFSEAQMNQEGFINYVTNAQETIRWIRRGRGRMAFLLNPIKPQQLKEVVASSHLIPRKSSYFYPKILTGLVINSLKL